MELQKRKKKSLLKIPAMIALGIVVAAVVIVFGLFHIRTVDVVGNEFYSAAEIEEMVMSGSLSENSLYLTWKYSNEETASSLPFLSAVEVTMISPYHVQIKVYEKTIAGYLMYSGSRVYFDTDGNVVEISGEERESIPPFSGISIGEPTVGESLPVEDGEFLSAIIEASQLLHQSGLTPDEVHYDDEQNLILYFGSNRILLGDDSYLEEKFSTLQALIPELEEEGLSGTLHMEDYTSSTTTITFKKGEEDEEAEELIINLYRTEETGETNEDGTAVETNADGTTAETNEDGTVQSESSADDSGYVEDPSRFSTDANGNEIYTDEQGNTTTNLDKPYLGDDGEIITDGYGYIDPYTGAYILN